MTQKIKVKIFFKSSPGRSVDIIHSGLSRDDVYKMCIDFMNKPSGTLKHNGTISAQIIDRTDVSMIDIQEIK